MIPSSLSSIVSFVAANKLAALLLLFAGMLIEGESFLIIAGVMVHIGAFSFLEIMVWSFVGVMVGDFLWYGLGVAIRRVKIAEKFIAIIERTVSSLLPQFREKPFLSLILAKYIYGTNHATLILSGVIGMNIWLFAKAEVIASSVWIIVFITVGYIFGATALLVTQKVSVFLLIVLVLILTFIGLQRAYSSYLENRRILEKK